jgi:hypothetical protein
MLLPSNEFFASRAVGASVYWISAWKIQTVKSTLQISNTYAT